MTTQEELAFAPPPRKEVARIRRLEEALIAFEEIDPSLPISYLRAFIAAAKEPGRGAMFYANRINRGQAVTSRILLELADKHRHREGGEGFQLLAVETDPDDRRGRRTRLTDEGRKLWDRIVEALI